MSDFEDENPLDKFHDECGVFGIYGHPEAANITYLGLYALQHRGQESAGIVTTHEGRHYSHRQQGLVADIFKEKTLEKLPGRAGIGHTRYSTTGMSLLKNVQPIVVDYARGPLAVAHNGNLVNTDALRAELEARGSIFQSTTDTEIVIHLLAKSTQEYFVDRLIEALARIEGAYSMVILTDRSLVAARDPLGFRPLVMGRLDGALVFASETCAFDLIGATFEREVEPGEVVIVNEQGMRHFHMPTPETPRRCIFELIYFARPDSTVFGQNVYMARKRLGRRLAEEAPAKADVVIPVPDSGVPGAMGYAEKLGLPLELGLIRNHYVGRTFIEPAQSIRNFGVKIKLNPNRSVIEGRSVVVIDDSIVRGTTSRKIIGLIRAAGAREVHMRITSPPTMWPCFYGIDTPERSKLVAATMTLEEIRQFVTADSVEYMSIEGMHAAVHANGTGRPGYCDACFSGDYPLIPSEGPVRQMSLFEV